MNYRSTRGRGAVLAATVMATAVSVWVALTWDQEWTLAVPVVATSIALIARHPRQRRVLASIGLSVLVVFSILGAWSIGMYYIPSAIALVVAIFRSNPRENDVAES